LADEGFVQSAVKGGPGTLLVIIEGEAIHVLLVAGLIAVPVREAETLASNPFPHPFAPPVAGSNPDLVLLGSAAESIAEDPLNIECRNRHQTTLVRLTDLHRGVPVQLDGMVFVVIIAEGRRRRRHRRANGGAVSGRKSRRVSGRTSGWVGVRTSGWVGGRTSRWVGGRISGRTGWREGGWASGREGGRKSGWVSRSGRGSFEAVPRQALADGAASSVIRVPTHASCARLADDAIGRVAHEETVLMFGIADVHRFFAAALKSPCTLATLPRSNLAVDTAVLATFHRGNGMNRRNDGFRGPGGRTRRQGSWLHGADVAAFGDRFTEVGAFATTTTIAPEEGLGTVSNGDLVWSAVLTADADDELVVVVRMPGVSDFIGALGQDRIANATAHGALLRHRLGFRRTFPSDFFPLDGAFRVLFVGHALLQSLTEKRIVDALHADCGSGVDGANDELALQLVVADKLRHVRMIGGQRLAVRLAKLLLVRWRVNGEADGAVRQRMDHASLLERVEVHARIAEHFLFFQNDGHGHLRLFFDDFRIALDQVGAHGTFDIRHLVGAVQIQDSGRILGDIGGVRGDLLWFFAEDDFGILRQVVGILFGPRYGHANQAGDEGVGRRGMAEIVDLVLDDLAGFQGARGHERRAVIGVMIRRRQVIQS